MSQLMRVLVTGARGFVGHCLVRSLLGQGVEVVCLDRPPARQDALSDLPLQRVTGDVRDESAVRRAIEGVDTVFHLAAATAPRSETEARQVNVDGTLGLAHLLARRASPPTLVHVSTLAVAGPNSEPVNETMKCRPVSIYGRTKLAAEESLFQMAGRLPLSIVRPPCVFGPNDRNMLGLYQSVRRGWNFISSPSFQYSFLHVDDLVSSLAIAAERGERVRDGGDAERTGVYYVADPQAVTFSELADLIAHCIGRERVRHVRVPRPVGWTAATLGESLQWVTRRRLFFNRDKAREAYGGSWVCDPRRAIEQLDFSPAARLAQRLAETAAGYRETGWLPG